MLGIFFLGFRFRAKQADDQRDRLLTGQRTLQLEALLGSLENTEGLQRLGLLLRGEAAASGGDCRYTAQEHRKQQQDCYAGTMDSLHVFSPFQKINAPGIGRIGGHPARLREMV